MQQMKDCKHHVTTGNDLIWLRVIDCETTGYDPDEDRVVEVGWSDIAFNKGIAVHDLTPESVDSMMVNPGINIPPTASAVHHIVDSDVEDALGIDEVLTKALPEKPEFRYVVAHNAPFDQGFLDHEKKHTWLDTLRLAKHAFPDAPSYSNQALRYYLGLDVPRHLPAHRVECDIITTGLIFVRICEELRQSRGDVNPGDLVVLQDEPILLKGKVGFGKYRDRKWEDLPRDYMEWMLKQGDDAWDKDIIHTIHHHLVG